MNSEILHKTLNNLGYRLPIHYKKEPSYTYEHQIAEDVFLYIKRKEGSQIIQKNLVIHPENIKIRGLLDKVEGLNVYWEPYKSTSLRRFPKFDGKSQYGYPADIESITALTELISLITVAETDQHKPMAYKKGAPTMTTNFPLNQILYGPPGTGKTYSTTEEAVKLAEPEWFSELSSTDNDDSDLRTAIKIKYDDLVNQGRITFTTFHQSFSYEDFVEGIRALSDEDKGDIRYEVVDGIFKQLCTSASVKVQTDSKQSINLGGRRVWKMSLGDTQGNEEHIFDECKENNYVLLGWGQDINFSACSNRADIKAKLEASQNAEVDKNSYEITSVNQFKNGIKIGDIIVISDGNNRFRAIAEVTEDYEFLTTEERVGYQQLRRVKWLRHYSPSLPKERLFKKALSQMTLYELRSATIDMTKLSALLEQPEVSTGKPLPHVLIIDEINRGNISRIFGELITLIEEDKRQGGGDQRTVILPYSKEPFTVPSNLYIIGTMNTADKSLAQLDLALRRRFEFIELLPKPDLLVDITVFNIKVSDILDIINQRIEVLLDRDHAIGHSHFWSLKKVENEAERESLIGTIFQKKIIPLLQEYFFSDWERISWVLNDIDKSKPAQFIQLENIGLPINELFSNSVVEEINDRRYRINEAAFSNPQSFIGILPNAALQ
jgi:5-methylcytosine-specific restriction protein B